jgi:predicted nucleic acid-binding protein
MDTNIIVYAYDSSAGKKHQTARDLLMECWDSGQGVISTQVLQEFFVTVTHKIPKPLAPSVAADIVSDFLTWDVVVNDGKDILQAISILQKMRLSFWDSLIISAAKKADCDVLLSEDLNPDQVVDGMIIKNPFL